MRKYMVYIDAGQDTLKIAVPANSVKAAKQHVEGNGEVVAVKDITDDFPIRADYVAGALYDTDFECILLGFRDDQLPDTVKAILQSKAIMEIEDQSSMGYFPLEIIGGYRYHMYINASGRCPGEIYIGSEAILSENYRKIKCKNPDYQAYLNHCQARGALSRNISGMFGCVTEYLAVYQTHEEERCISQLVNHLFNMVNV